MGAVGVSIIINLKRLCVKRLSLFGSYSARSHEKRRSNENLANFPLSVPPYKNSQQQKKKSEHLKLKSQSILLQATNVDLRPAPRLSSATPSLQVLQVNQNDAPV